MNTTLIMRRVIVQHNYTGEQLTVLDTIRKHMLDAFNNWIR